MKALTLWQPWASLIALGVKTIETRSWSTTYRGPLAIHASKRAPRASEWRVADWWIDEGPSLHRAGRELPSGMVDYSGVDCTHFPIPFGAVVGTCELVDVVPMTDPDDEATPCLVVEREALTLCLGPSTGQGHTDRDVSDQYPYGDFSPGRFAWLLADIRRLNVPVPAKGRQGLWEWNTEEER